MKILFICTGNICRSPMAEVIFTNLCKKRKKTGVVIKGAGTHASDGETMTQQAHEALKICGEGKQPPRPSTLWHESMLHEYDHIVCMTQKHASKIDPLGNHKNVYTLDDVVKCGDIFDPWMHPIETYVMVCKQLQSALKILYNHIWKK